ncbi:MAG TPA: acyltransferase family protein [Gammaproteobacteria bacterium]|nr:acyltransferase family protein [Gammaproteobacteria bacterium]
MSSQQRLHALDAVRAFALLAGIVLHATMSFFLPIPAQDVSQSTVLATVFSLIHPWRMTTFFLIAGLFARLVIEKRGTRGFVSDRAKRIVVPLVVGWVILAPLTIGALIWGVARTADPAAREAMSAAVAAGTGTVGAFPLVHLWFLYYLVIFYVLLLAVRAAFSMLDSAGRVSGVVDKIVRPLLGSYVAPFVLGLPLFAVMGFDPRIVLMGGIPTPDSSLIPQLPALAGFGTAFALGWFVHRQLDLLGQWRKRWIGHLVIGLALFAAYSYLPGLKPGTTAAWLPAEWGTTPFAVCYILGIWYLSFGVIGAALKLCANESPARRYLADSSYWMYLAHLPIVFFLAAALAKVPLHWAIKFPLILGITIGVLLASYHYLVRPTWIGEILNGRRYPRARAASPQPNGPTGPKRGLKPRAVDGEFGAASQPQPSDATTAAAAAALAAEPPLAELVRATKRYGTTVALAGLDLEVRRGEVLAVLGPNGAGKSTAISLWLGLLQPDQGEARLMSRSPLDVEARREVGLMLQEVVLQPTMRVRELIALTASYYPSPLTVAQTLELTGTKELADKLASKLSAGQKRQVQFALAICGRPRLLFLDEPTVGLDVQARETMWRTMRELIAQGCSIVLTTHYLEEAEALADRVAVLARGELIALGTVDDVRSIVSRKKITCSSALPVGAVRAWPGVVDATGDHHRMQITTADAEAVVRRLLASDQNLRNLEIKQAGLAEAFAELTKEAA